MNSRWQLWIAAGLLAGCKTTAAPSSTAPTDAQAQAETADDGQSELAATDARRHEAALAEDQQFLADHGDDPEQAAQVLQATVRIGKSQAALGRHDEAKASYRDVIARFEAAGFNSSEAEADAPAEATFLLAEYALEDVLNLQLTGDGELLEESTRLLMDALVDASGKYDAVFPYRRIDWALAAMVRKGRAFEEVAIKVRAHPAPSELEEQDAIEAYHRIVDDFATRLDHKAVELYSETVLRGKELSIDNEWTRSAQEHLAGLLPPGDADQS
ncbi:MAG: tetratricopeptide repeat protein [Myxococcota bacterium]